MMKKWFKDKAGIAEDYVQSGITDGYRVGHDRIFGGPSTDITIIKKAHGVVAPGEPARLPDLSHALLKIKHWYMQDRWHERFPANALQDALTISADFAQRGIE